MPPFSRPPEPAAIERLIDTLRCAELGPAVFNPYRDRAPDDAPGNGPQARCERLAAHLDRAARLVLVGEAAGWLGCRSSGIPFTSEATLLERGVPGIGRAGARLSVLSRVLREPSATIVWRTLDALSLSETTVLTNAFPGHPHRPDEPFSNRTPSTRELRAANDLLAQVLALYPAAEVVAVGRKAEAALTALRVPHQRVRHPAHGGATEFAAGLASVRGRAA